MTEFLSTKAESSPTESMYKGRSKTCTPPPPPPPHQPTANSIKFQLTMAVVTRRPLIAAIPAYTNSDKSTSEPVAVVHIWCQSSACKYYSKPSVVPRATSNDQQWCKECKGCIEIVLVDEATSEQVEEIRALLKPVVFNSIHVE